ncbi:MAG: hypothetical protein PHE67_10415 [Campylobacterales bacterium]|nr:hypothetical protein [Campylobacterales bacterium]
MTNLIEKIQEFMPVLALIALIAFAINHVDGGEPFGAGFVFSLQPSLQEFQ